MRLDNRFALGYSVQNLGYTMGYIIAHNELDKHRRQRYTYHRAEDIPPVVLAVNEKRIDKILNKMDEEFEHIGSQGG